MAESSAQDYRWDVFLSYRRGKLGEESLADEWVRDNFKMLLRSYLTEELGGHGARVFFDQQVIKTGDDWADGISDGIRLSKCLVAVWTPSYWRSDWCTAEWNSFRERSEVARLGPSGLAAPVLLCGDRHLPPEAKAVQYADFQDYAYLGLRETALFLSFQQKVQELARNIARVVHRAPLFRTDWRFNPPDTNTDSGSGGPPVPRPQL